MIKINRLKKKFQWFVASSLMIGACTSLSFAKEGQDVKVLAELIPGKPGLSAMILPYVMNGGIEPTADAGKKLGKGICYGAGKGSDCAYVDNLGKGICVAAGLGSDCAYVDNLGKGVCVAAGKGSECTYVDNLGKGLCYAAGKGSACTYVDSVGKGVCVISGKGSECGYI